jgi:hypothetical protein
MTNTTPKGSGTISADEGNEVIEVLTCNKSKILDKTRMIKCQKIHRSFIRCHDITNNTFSGIIQCFSFLITIVHVFFNIATCITNQKGDPFHIEFLIYFIYLAQEPSQG